MKANDDKKPETESAKIIEAVAQEAEQVITKACEAAKQEAEQELEKALREYEQKTRQIVLKIKEEAKARTVEIASRLGEAIMMRIEKSSTEAVSDAVAEFSKKAERITQTLQEATGKEAEQTLTGVKAGVESGIGSNGDNDDARKDVSEDEATSTAGKQQEQQKPEWADDQAKPGFKIEVEQELADITEDESNGGTQQDSEKFEHWLTQE